MRKAERAAARHGPRDSDSGNRSNTIDDRDAAVPPPAEDQTVAAARQQQITADRYVLAAARHQVWLRDQGQCTHMYPDGSRCQEKMMLELDHINLFCRGGEKSASNLSGSQADYRSVRPLPARMRGVILSILVSRVAACLALAMCKI